MAFELRVVRCIAVINQRRPDVLAAIDEQLRRVVGVDATTGQCDAFRIAPKFVGVVAGFTPPVCLRLFVTNDCLGSNV